jgi:hypothetical protein
MEDNEEIRMKAGSRRAIVAALATTIVWIVGVALVTGQAGPGQKPLMAEDVFKNVQVLRGISVNEFMGTMGIFSASLGMSCGDCHQGDDSAWENFAVDNARKNTTRRMVTMMAAINKANFQGRQVVTCYSCHRGADRPKVTVDLAAFYGPAPENPNHIITQAPLAPSADQVLDKYIQALGGAQRLANLTSFVATGISVGYGPEAEKRPVEIFGRAPAQRTTVIHTANGDSTTTYDGQAAWISAPLRPVDVLALSGQDLESTRLEAVLSFPGQIKQALRNWRVGVPIAINGRDVQVVQGTSAGRVTATLYFDDESGLLVRLVRYTDSPVGPISTQTDYADYRDVAGVKIPYRWTVTWLDGRDSVELSQVRPNVQIDAARFARPGPPVRPPDKPATP